MKNSYLILGFIAIAAIVFVVWYAFLRAPKYSGWASFSAPYRPISTKKKLYNCRHADGTYQNQTEPCGGTNIR